VTADTSTLAQTAVSAGAAQGDKQHMADNSSAVDDGMRDEG